MSLKKYLLLLLVCFLAVSVSVARADDGESINEGIDIEEVDEAEVEEVEEEEEEEGPKDVFTEEEREAMKENEESFEFQAEVNRLMDIIINSLYSNREIFVRELISNAADALDKIRYQGLLDKDALASGDELKIDISFDKEAKTLSFRDTGVGMTKEELVKNLGVVARSGTTEFVEAASGDAANPLSLIGQFGVGFYSVYLAADKVTVVSKSNSDVQYIWESTADKTFTITKDPRGDTLGRGTEVILHLKEDAEEFLNESKLTEIVGKYSQFINFPISLLTTKTVSKEVPIEPEEGEDDEEAAEGEDDDLEVSDEEDEDAAPKTKTVKEEVQEWKRLNEVKAIWTRPKEDVTDEEYNEFYKSLTKGDDEPLTKIHFSAEGEISFRSILYIPTKAEANLYDKYYEKSQSLKLYVRRVLIADEFDDFLPRYLNFVKGVVDSEDLPLNVSRETLAQSRVLKVMSKKLTRKVLEMLRKMAAASEEMQDEGEEDEEEAEAETTEDNEEAEADTDGEDGDTADEEEEEEEEEKVDQYAAFWEEFGKSIKLGLIDDRANKSKLSKLLRFRTNKSEGKYISLERYVDNMDEDQKFIYYITGESVENVESSPFLEQLNKRELEVIYMTDPLDEYVTQSLTEFDGNQLMSVTKEGLKFGDEDEKKEERIAEAFEPFTSWLAETYGEKVEKVTVSNRLGDSPCVLVTGQYGWTANMERIMKAQTFSDSGKSTWMHAKKTMEINPRHPIIRELRAKAEANGEDETVIDLANLMYDAALVASGFSMEDPKTFSTRINRLVSLSLDVDPNAPIAEEIPEEIEEEEEEEEEEAEEEVEAEDAEEAEEAEEAEDEEEAEEAEEEEEAEEASHDEL